MNINYEYPVMVFRKDNQYGTTYSIGLSKKQIDGSYLNGYMPIRFKKGVKLDNQSKIFMKNAFLTFYLGGNPKRTLPYIMCTDFEIVQFDKPQQENEYANMSYKTQVPTADFDISIKDEDLPF